MSNISEAYVEKLDFFTTSLVNHCTQKQQNFSLYDLTHKRCFSCDCDKIIPQKSIWRKRFRHCDGCLFNYKELLLEYGATRGTRMRFLDAEPFLTKDHRFRKDKNSPAQYYNTLVAFGFIAYFIGNKCHNLILDDNSRETLLSIFDAYYQESKQLYESKILQSGELNNINETIPESDFIKSHKEKENTYFQLIEQKVEDDEENFRSILLYLTPESQEDLIRYGRLYLSYIDNKLEALVKNEDTKANEFSSISQEDENVREYMDHFCNPDVIELLSIAIEKKIVAKNGKYYRWLHSNALFGYFTDKTSEVLALRYNERIPWKMYQTMFQMEDPAIRTARQTVAKYNSMASPPKGDDIVDDIISCYLSK